ncbi:Bardet-Biedl syndrome 4 protein, partial [Irineochytrium annulatum]
MSKFPNLSGRIHQLFVTKQFPECLALIHAAKQDEDATAWEYGTYIAALIKRHEGRISESLKASETLAQVNPTNSLNLKQMARCLYLTKNPTLALAAYDEALKYAGKDWEIYHNKGICLSLLEDFKEAEEMFKIALTIHAHESTFSCLGRMYLTTGDYASAFATYQQALEINPENVDFLVSLGLLYLKENREDKACTVLGRALCYDPVNVKAIIALGSILQSNGDYDGALMKYRTACLLHPDSPYVWNNVGMCFYGKGKLVAAVSCLRHAHYLHPFQPEISFNLGLCFLRTDQLASA